MIDIKTQLLLLYYKAPLWFWQGFANFLLKTMYYITDPDLYTIQYLLQNILNEASTIKQMQQQLGLALTKNGVIPTETLKFALCVLGSIPVLIMFPFFQRYYSKGMIVGSVKG